MANFQGTPTVNFQANSQGNSQTTRLESGNGRWSLGVPWPSAVYFFADECVFACSTVTAVATWVLPSSW